ncbi:MAG: hypothetical protein AAGE52_07010 [Myxococcota bacterium]
MWRVEYDPDRRLLTLRLRDLVNPGDIRELASAQAEALSCTAGTPFRVLVDLRRLFPLEQEAVDLFAELKRVVHEQQGFRGLVVLTDSATVAMQQHHTRVRQGTDPERELITTQNREAEAFLERPME